MIPKGEHKHVFPYAVEEACDKNGWLHGYIVNPDKDMVINLLIDFMEKSK